MTVYCEHYNSLPSNNVTDMFLRLCVPFLGQQMELDEFKVTIDSILQQFLDQLQSVEVDNCYSDLRNYIQSLIRDLDFWNHVMVKTKLGILKSKIKKVDFIYNNKMPDVRLDPTPGSQKESLKARENSDGGQNNPQVKFISLPQKPKRLADNRWENSPRNNNSSHQNSPIVDKLNLQSFQDEEPSVDQTTVDVNTIRKQPANEFPHKAESVSEASSDVALSGSFGDTTRSDIHDAPISSRDRKSPVVVPVAIQASPSEPELLAAASAGNPVKDALKSLRVEPERTESRVQVKSIESNSWVQIKKLHLHISKPVLIKGNIQPVTCHCCQETNRPLQNLRVTPDDRTSNLVICDDCLKCSQCQTSFHSYPGSVFVQQNSSDQAELRCRVCIPVKCGPCIVCQEPTNLETVEPNFYVQFCSVGEAQRFPKSKTGRKKDKRDEAIKSTFSIHKNCLKCVSCSRRFAEDQICFLQWKDSPENQGAPKVVLYDAACRLHRCDFCHWYPSLTTEFVGSMQNRLKVQVCHDERCKERFRQFREIYCGTTSRTDRTRLRKKANTLPRSTSKMSIFSRCRQGGLDGNSLQTSESKQTCAHSKSKDPQSSGGGGGGGRSSSSTLKTRIRSLTQLPLSRSSSLKNRSRI